MTKSIIHAKVFAVLTFFALLPFIADTAIAEIKTFEKEYTYQASEIDSKVTSRAIAVEQVKRLVLEELGTYLMAETEVKDFRITKDKVIMLTAGIVQTEILNEKWDGEKYHLKARMKADPKEVAASLDRLRKDTQKSKELEDAKKKASEAFQEIEKLKSDLEAVKADQNKLKEYAKAADTISAADWFNKGMQSSSQDDFDASIKAFTSAIVLKPDYYDAYINRGKSYEIKEHYQMAIEDFSKAIAIEPDAVPGYFLRGIVYQDYKGQYSKAIEDYSKAIALMPNSAVIYNRRSLAYKALGQDNRAIEDHKEACALGYPFDCN